jgi:hypothetical protein
MMATCDKHQPQHFEESDFENHCGSSSDEQRSRVDGRQWIPCYSKVQVVTSIVESNVNHTLISLLLSVISLYQHKRTGKNHDNGRGAR